jgi:transposase
VSKRVRRPNRFYTPEQRIGACADYLLGKSYLEIEQKWNVLMATVYGWIRRTGSFKMRQTHRRVPSIDNSVAPL